MIYLSKSYIGAYNEIHSIESPDQHISLQPVDKLHVTLYLCVCTITISLYLKPNTVIILTIYL